MRRRGLHLAVVAAAVVLMGIGPGGCHKLDHRTAPQKLDQAMSKAFTDEETPIPDDGEALPPRERDLPITPAGLTRLRAELVG